MKQRHRFAVAVVLLITSSPSIAEAQSGPDAPLQRLIESTQPAGYVATPQSPNVGLLGADALAAFNPDGVVYTPQDFVEHEIGFYGWHWTSTAEPAGSRRVITIVGLSSKSGAEPRELVAVFASDRREAGKKEADLTIPDSSAFTGITDDGKQTSLDVAFIRNDRAIIVSAFGGDPNQLKADVASLTEQLALGAENLPSRVEHSSRGGTILLAAALILVLALVAGFGAFVRKSRGRPRSATSANVSTPQIS
ncbi:MAG TPA: hypothetical protein VM282_03905 [Acidimicrobiales bacterium]|nr:hypothetical protein [Acidimicrobiales bacterium]